jgi:hypothetical protein
MSLTWQKSAERLRVWWLRGAACYAQLIEEIIQQFQINSLSGGEMADLFIHARAILI